MTKRRLGLSAAAFLIAGGLGSPAIAQALAPDFHGRISYSGTYEGQITTPGPPLRRLAVGSILRSATGGSSRQFAGGYSVELEVNGNAVTGRYSGTGGIDSISFSGTRQGNTCRLFADRTGAAIEAECGAARFAGTVTSPQGQRRPYKIRFEASATRLVDSAQEQRERQAATAAAQADQQRQTAERERRAAEEVAFLRSRPTASSAQRAMVERALQRDSTNWMFNRYDVGSLGDVRILEAAGGTVVLRGTYTFNGGDQGWVKARLRGGAVECLQFWDRPDCTAPRRTADVDNGSGPPLLTTIAISSRTWYLLDKSEEPRAYEAFTDVERIGPGRLRYKRLAFFTDLDFIALDVIDVDCTRFTDRVVGLGKVMGDRVTIYEENGEEKSSSPGTVGRSRLQRVCSRSGWQRVADPLSAGRDFISGRTN